MEKENGSISGNDEPIKKRNASPDNCKLEIIAELRESYREKNCRMMRVRRILCAIRISPILTHESTGVFFQVAICARRKKTYWSSCFASSTFRTIFHQQPISD